MGTQRGVPQGALVLAFSPPSGAKVTLWPPHGGAQPLTAARPPAPKRSAEAWSWAFMRLSGLVLVFLALAHFAITHIVNDVVDTDYDFVAERWDNPAWRLFDWLLLVLALAHGMNGLRWIVEDYIRRPGRRKAVKGALYALTGALLVVGTLTVLAFPSRPQ